MESKYKILACAGFGWSGSGIVTDYLLEFDNIKWPGKGEIRFLHDFGGISTLEDCLVHSHHRLNSDMAIRMFKKYVDYQSGDFLNKRYNNIFDGQFKTISYDFIDSLSEAKWIGHWEDDQVFASKAESILCYKILTRLKRFVDCNRKKIGAYYPQHTMYYSNPDLEDFQACVKNYLNELFKAADPKHESEFLYFDQMLPPTNIDRYFAYFDDLHVVVVDRDPRDAYINNIITANESFLPSDIDQFIKVYKSNRRKINTNEHQNILRVNMEDTIYHYDEFSKRVNEFIGLDERNHVNRRKFFNPDVSIKNTKQWEKIEVDMDIIHKIEDGLGEYCYNF